MKKSRSISNRWLMTLPLIAGLLFCLGQARASGANDAREFHLLLRSLLTPEMKNNAALVHMIPDQDVLAASEASSVDEAMSAIKRSSLAKLHQATKADQSLSSLDAEAVLKKRPLTIVLVPGIFGEFIKTRAFEEVLAKPSQERDAFEASVAKAAAAKDTNAEDMTFDIKSLKPKSAKLDKLVHVGSIKDKSGQTVARVVLFYTSFMTLESMGGLKESAAMFNRRLEKYLAMTGPQDLAFIGYSRGTVLGLEMLSQAKEKNAAWLPSVRAMIGLGGVVWGSTLADDTENPESAIAKAVKAIRELRNSIDPNSATTTIKAWGSFLYTIAGLAPKLNEHPVTPNDPNLKTSFLNSGVDSRSLLGLILVAGKSLGLNAPWTGFSENVRRFQSFVDAALDGTGQLTSRARIEWWKTHEIPKSVRYYSMTAAMANPELGETDKLAFETKIGYSKSFDDLSLLQNRLDYESLSGASLNDSQVSVAQAMLLPKVAASLNPANSGLKSITLGVAGTHHWGLALQTVNAMADGRLNPYPREALLKALAAKVVLDLGTEP